MPQGVLPPIRDILPGFLHATGTEGIRGIKGLLDVKIDALNKNAVEISLACDLFRTASAILSLVRDKMIEDPDSVQLSGHCFDACEALKGAIQGGRTGSLDKPQKQAVEDLRRAMWEIERALKKGTSTAHAKHDIDKEMMKSHVLKVQRAVEALGSRSERACGRLIRRAFTLDEMHPIIEEILLSEDKHKTIRSLPTDGAQTLIDVIYGALHMPDLSPLAKKRYMKLLYKTCGSHALLPGALNVPYSCAEIKDPRYRGGYADVWKGECFGLNVAIKVLRTYSDDGLQKIIKKFCREVVIWKFLRHPNVLPLIGVSMTENHLAMISGWMPNGNINEYIEAHPDADRLGLLMGATEGVIYLHNNGMVHGDLKGANILVNEAGHPRLADFGLLTITSDPANLLSSDSQQQGGTIRWMSPELIAPQQFGRKESHFTKSSDCYALGMVVYETISGNLPFHGYSNFQVSLAVMMTGTRPARSEAFPGSLWKMLESCWAYKPSDRPSAREVLQRLRTISGWFRPAPPGVNGKDEEEDEETDNEDSDIEYGESDTGDEEMEVDPPGSDLY